MAYEVMHLTVQSHDDTMEGARVIARTTNVPKSSGIHNVLCSGEESYYMQPV